ncbi:MAG: histidine kinase [Flavobacterium sp.]
MKLVFDLDLNPKNQTRVLLHTLVWLMFFSIPLYNIAKSPNLSSIGSFVVFFLLWVMAFYFNYFILVPKFLIAKRWKSYIALLLLSFTIQAIVSYNLEPFGPKPPDDKKHHFDKGMEKDPSFRLFPTIGMFILIMSASTTLKIYEIWDENSKKKKEIENQNRISELNFLKAQLNPHFFFNSLNTIYSLSISQSPKTSNAILNLSELMRYMLSNRKDTGVETKVRLTDEIEYTNNYIELQKLRITPNNFVDFTIDGNIDKLEVYPLLFISFIENAFKFGVHPVEKSVISINFKLQGAILEFSVKNPIHFQKKSYDSFGLGNENSIRRLNLYYPENELKIEATDTYYNVNIKIKTGEN